MPSICSYYGDTPQLATSMKISVAEADLSSNIRKSTARALAYQDPEEICALLRNSNLTHEATLSALFHAAQPIDLFLTSWLVPNLL